MSSVEKAMEPNEEFEVEIIDPTPEEDKNRTALPEETPEEVEARAKEMDDYGDRVQKRFGELTHRFHDERRAKEEAIRARDEADQFAQKVYEENERLKQTLNNGYGEYITTYSQRLDYAQALAEATYKQGHESGDTDKMMAAQRAFSEIAAERAKLATFSNPVNNTHSERPERLTQRQEPERISQEAVYEPAPEMADPQTEAWYARNPWFNQDDEMTALALGVHSKILKEGVIEPSSNEYFERIDREVRQRFPEKFGKPRKTSPVAPAGRTTTATKKVTLTTSEVERAKKMGIPLERYAREKAKLMEAN
jgi:hypothetical protein